MATAITGCVHDPVFSGERWLTGTPGWHWICRSCGALGVAWQKEKPTTDLRSYAAALRAVDPKAAAFYEARLLPLV